MIQNGHVVTITYVPKDAAGVQLDTSVPGEPFVYLHGAGQIVPGLESALEGAAPGTRKTLVVPTKDTYGEELPDVKTLLALTEFPPGIPPETGRRFRAQVEGGEIIFAVEKVAGDRVFINGNHPLAGKDHHFDVEVLDVRPATAGEVGHGH